MFLKRLLDEGDRLGHGFSIFIQSMILFSMLLFAFETMDGLSKEAIMVLNRLNLVIVAIFTLEYGIRVFGARRPLGYVFSLWGLIDLLAILPFYVSTGLDLRAIRVFRLLRILIYFKLFRYNKGIRMIKRSFQMIYGELAIVFLSSLFALYLVSMGIFYFESQAQPNDFGNLFDCLWWAIVTLTTVGYGDVVPVTTGGRLFTGLILLIGIGMISVPTAIISSAFLQIRNEDDTTI